MLKIADLQQQMLNEPAQPHQQQSIIGKESAKYFEFGTAAQTTRIFVICTGENPVWMLIVGEGGFVR
jgi:hypothetical protein